MIKSPNFQVSQFEGFYSIGCDVILGLASRGHGLAISISDVCIIIIVIIRNVSVHYAMLSRLTARSYLLRLITSGFVAT